MIKMVIDKSRLFKEAWKLAKETAKERGGKAKDFIGKALKRIWKNLKEEAERKVKTMVLDFEYTSEYGAIVTLADRSVTTYEYKDFIKEAGFKWDGYRRTWYKKVSLAERTSKAVAEQAKEIRKLFADKENIDLYLSRETYRYFCAKCREKGLIA